MTRYRDPDRMPFAAHASLLLQFLAIAQGITLCNRPLGHPETTLVLSGSGISALLTLAMFLRQNWARFAWLWGYAILGILQPVFYRAIASAPVAAFRGSRDFGLAEFFDFGTTLLALVLVFLPSSSRWFRCEVPPNGRDAWATRNESRSHG